MTAQQTYYEVLHIRPDAKLIEIKKSYRRLALLHHPDRTNNDPESTERFKLIGEAYEVLSDKSKRQEYDQELKLNIRDRSGNTNNYRQYHSFVGRTRRSVDPRKNRVDPFAQFDDLFRNDPFFRGGLDDLFAKKFQQEQNSTDKARSSSSAMSDETMSPTISTFCCSSSPPKQQQHQQQGWGSWILNRLGVQIQMSSYHMGADGSISASQYSSHPKHDNYRRRGGGTYTKKQAKAFVENGRKVMIQSMERDGNVIEDKYVDGALVERKINGILEDVGRIGESN